MVIAQFSEQLEDVSISCREALTVETKEVNAQLQWDFRVQTEVRAEPSPRSSRREPSHLSCLCYFEPLELEFKRRITHLLLFSVFLYLSDFYSLMYVSSFSHLSVSRGLSGYSIFSIILCPCSGHDHHNKLEALALDLRSGTCKADWPSGGVDSVSGLTFSSFTQRQLVHVALLKQEPGADFSLGEMSLVPCIYSSGECFYKGDLTYDIRVSFTTASPGLYEQWLALDFDMRPVLLKKLRIRTGKVELDDHEEGDADRGSVLQGAELWHGGNRDIVPCLPRTEDQEKLLKEYKRPERLRHHASPLFNSQTPVNQKNYKERMHQFLYEEEQAEAKVVSR